MSASIDEPPKADAPVLSEPGPRSPLEAGGFWIRALARAIDLLAINVTAFFAAIALMLAAMIAYAIAGGDTAALIQSMDEQGPIAWVGGLFALVVYHTAFEGLAGSTVGKRLTGLQVIGVDGAPIRTLQAFKRSLAFFVDALFFGMIAAHFMSESDEKQRIGDHWAETRVVRRRSLPAERLPSTPRMLSAFLIAASAATAIYFVTLLLNYVWQVRA